MNLEVKKRFNKIKRLLRNDGLYLPVYDTVIEHAAETLYMLEVAREKLDDYQKQIQTYETGARACSPELNNYRGLLADFRKYSELLALSPAGRDKLKIPLKKPKAKSRLMSIRNNAKTN